VAQVSYQSIGTNEVDANSPLSSTLMSKIRNNLYWLFESSIPDLFLDDYDHAEPTAANITVSPKDQWVTVQDFGLVRLRPAAKTVKLNLRIGPSNCVNNPRHAQKVKFQLYDLGNGNTLNDSNEFIFTANGWAAAELAVTDPATGFVGLRVLCFQENGGCMLESDWWYHRSYGWVDSLK
jgi:hypothetical protein